MAAMEPEYEWRWWSDGDLLDNWANASAAIGDALTFDLTFRIRDTFEINGGIDPSRGIYQGGYAAGTVLNMYLTGGAGLTARTPAVARMMVRAYTATDIAVARVQWGHRVLTGQATVMDALPLARYLGPHGRNRAALGMVETPIAPRRELPILNPNFTPKPTTLGRVGETLAGMTGKKSKIVINARNRIPDGFDTSGVGAES